MTTPTLEDVAQLNHAYELAEAALQNARDLLTEQQVKHAGFQERLASLHADEPTVIYAAPDAPIDDAAIARAVKDREAARSKREAWETELVLIERAAAKASSDVEAAAATFTHRQDEMHRMWRAFVRAAQTHLMGRFRQEFTALRMDTLDALVTLTGDPCVPTYPYVCDMSQILVRSNERTEKLLDIPKNARKRPASPVAPEIARFRASLPPVAACEATTQENA